MSCFLWDYESFGVVYYGVVWCIMVFSVALWYGLVHDGLVCPCAVYLDFMNYGAVWCIMV